MKTATLFISAVTDEFRSCRDAVAKWLDGPGMRIETQEKFLALGQTTLVKLSDYIHQCDAVVHLVGDRTGNASGSVGNPKAVQCLLEAYRDLPHSLGLSAETISGLSYTQWEAWLAIYHKKRLFIALPEATAPRDRRLDDEALSKAQSEDQKAHLAALASHGRYPEIRFASSDQLCLGLVPLRDILLRGARNELGLNNILSLSEYRASLAGFRRFLSSSNLPFQAPRHDNPCHPEELLKTLETSVDAKGVLLAGAGGVGKTRTTFETAQLAESQGWRIVYALPGQPAVTAEKIVEAVLAHGPGKTMVVIEYLDQMQELDLGVLRRHLIQTSAQHGIQFGLMANCRPGLLLKTHPERDATFDTVILAPTPQEAEILSHYVVTHTAPQAVQILGEQELLRLCGHRPIIALLVAQQLEQLAAASRLQPREFTAVRSGDLAHWLRRRLAEDKLVMPESESIWDNAPPPPHLIAAATALACAPDEDSACTAAAASALQAIGHPDSTAARVTAVLVAVGWLERDGLWLHVVHDVVADELVEQCIFELDAIRCSQLHALLSPALTRARSFGRLAKTFTRVEGAISSHRLSPLRFEAERWLKEMAREIGKTLAADEANNGSYALGAVLGGSLFEDFAIEGWSDLVTPWLAKHKTAHEARHLLFRGLRTHHDNILAELIPIAMAWLERWRYGQPASFVFGPLLRVISSGEMASTQVIDWSVEWLARFFDNVEVQFVLAPLLKRADLQGAVATRAITLALQWLEKFPDQPEAQFVLAPLLKRADLQGEAATRTITPALQWLEKFPDKPAARFVLASLLGRADLQGEAATRTITFALQWLANFLVQSEAQFVLAPLLRRADLQGEAATRTITLALQWLANFLDQSETQFVLAPLLERADLKSEAALQATTQALQWLEKFPAHEGTDFVFKRILERADLKGEAATQAITQALQWLERFPEHEGADFVFKRILERADLKGEAALQAITRALQWLKKFPDKPAAGFVLGSLLERADLKGEAAIQAITQALQWLNQFPNRADGGFVLAPLLERADLKGEAATQAITQALQWLNQFSNRTDGGFVLAPLLERADLKGEVANHGITLALQWLERFSEHEGTDFVLKRLLERTDLKGEAANHGITLALRWLERFPEKPQAGFVLAPLLGRDDLNGKAATQAIALALQWLEKFGKEEKAGFVLVAWYTGALKKDLPDRAQELSQAWSANYPKCGGGGRALVLKLCGLRPEVPERRTVVTSALAWVRTHEKHHIVGDVLLALLENHSDMDGVIDIAVTSALYVAWRNGLETVRKSLSVALRILPVGDSRRDEIEVLLESEA